MAIVMEQLLPLRLEGKKKRGLEIVQNRADRRGLGSNRHVATEALRGEIGWSTFQERIDKTKIKYRIRLEHMNDRRWAKKIFKWRGKKSAFRKETNRNMRIDMKITNNDENFEIKMNRGIVERERKVQNGVIKAVKKEGLKNGEHIWKRKDH